MTKNYKIKSEEEIKKPLRFTSSSRNHEPMFLVCLHLREQLKKRNCNESKSNPRLGELH